MIKRPSSLRLLKMVRQSTDDRASILESTPWLLDLTYKKIRDIAYYMEGYSLRDGNVLFEEGDDEAYLVVIVSGDIDITKLDSTQTSKFVTTLREGRVFGEMSLLDGEPRSATAIAKGETMIYVLTKERFDILQKEEPEAALSVTLKMAKAISQKLRQTTGQWVELVNEKNG